MLIIKYENKYYKTTEICRPLVSEMNRIRLYHILVSIMEILTIKISVHFVQFSNYSSDLVTKMKGFLAF